MKKYNIFCIIFLCFLSGCGNGMVNDWVNRQENYCEIPQQTHSVDSREPKYVYNFEEVDITYNPNTTKFVIDNHNIQREYKWNVGMNNGEDEIIFEVGSFLNNGKEQIVYHPVVEVGTGILLEELHVVDVETLEEYVIEDFRVDEEQILVPETLDKEKIFIGSYQYYELKENSIIVNLNVSIQTYEILGVFEGVIEEKDNNLYVREWTYVESIENNQ